MQCWHFSDPSACPRVVLPLDFRVAEVRDHVFSSVPGRTDNNSCCFMSGNYVPGKVINTLSPLFPLIQANDPILQMETWNIREVMWVAQVPTVRRRLTSACICLPQDLCSQSHPHPASACAWHIEDTNSLSDMYQWVRKNYECHVICILQTCDGEGVDMKV